MRLSPKVRKLAFDTPIMRIARKQTIVDAKWA